MLLCLKRGTQKMVQAERGPEPADASAPESAVGPAFRAATSVAAVAGHNHPSPAAGSGVVAATLAVIGLAGGLAAVLNPIAGSAGLTPMAWAGGPENSVLIIDPSDPVSRYVGNYYRIARDIPASNVIYMNAAATNFPEFANVNRPAFLGMLANRGLDTHIDQVIIAPGVQYQMSAPGLVSDGCFEVRRFSASSPFFMSWIADEVLGGVASTLRNQYYSITDEAIAFDSRTSWYLGDPSSRPEARRYFLSTLLGYTGDRGNTVSEVLDMIDRSVAVDGTRPAGTFYYMETNDSARSGPRDPFFDAAVAAIQAQGGQAEHLCCNPLPTGEQDVLGIMTGVASFDLASANINIQPGAFCDHLTSFAANFGTDSQTKASVWIANGASGTHGAVEEPCNYGGKFPHPRMHVFYHQGATLAEAVYRSLLFVPFQGLVMGDPLTRPFAYIPEVRVPDFPTGEVSGRITISPEATTNNPGAAIAGFDLFINGVLVDTANDGERLYIESRRLPDGVHDVRVIARDDSSLRTPGRFVDRITVRNNGLSAGLAASTNAGDLSTPFEFTVSPSSGAAIEEIRLVHNDRVIGSSSDRLIPITVYGNTFGAGPSEVQAEVWYADGRRVRSDFVSVEVADDAGLPSAADPIAYGYTTSALAGETIIIQLPAAYDDVDATIAWDMTEPPAQATLISADSGPYRIFTAAEDAAGVDTLRFTATAAGGGTSDEVTISIAYQDRRPGDLALSVGVLVKGEEGEATLTGGFPDEPAWLLYSFSGTGSRYVPQLNVEIGLLNPVLAGPPVQTDASGVARWSTTIPGSLKTPKIIWLQAAQRDQASNVVLTQVN